MVTFSYSTLGAVILLVITKFEKKSSCYASGSHAIGGMSIFVGILVWCWKSLNGGLSEIYYIHIIAQRSLRS